MTSGSDPAVHSVCENMPAVCGWGLSSWRDTQKTQSCIRKHGIPFEGRETRVPNLVPPTYCAPAVHRLHRWLTQAWGRAVRKMVSHRALRQLSMLSARCVSPHKRWPLGWAGGVPRQGRKQYPSSYHSWSPHSNWTRLATAVWHQTLPRPSLWISVAETTHCRDSRGSAQSHEHWQLHQCLSAAGNSHKQHCPWGITNRCFSSFYSLCILF